jgi:branched-chain amino acid transport system substrate-binding protein
LPHGPYLLARRCFSREFAVKKSVFAKALKVVGMALFALAFSHAKAAEPVQIALIESLSGPFANAGEAVYRNLVWATERVNARGGVTLADGKHPLLITRYDNQGQVQESLAALSKAIADGARFIAQGNSSSVAAALIDAVNKNNERTPNQRVLLLNYAALDPGLTNELCSFWHFRFDAHADMRMNALMQVLKDDKALKSVYLIGQDYSFGQAVLREAKRQLAELRPDIRVVGEELHPIGRIKDFLPYAQKIKSRGAQAVITGNWGNDLTLLIKAAKDAGFEGKFYTFYGNALGAPAAIGDAGVDRVVAAVEWLPNVPGEPSEAFYKAFHRRFPKPEDDYVHLRMQLMMEALAQAIDKAGTTEALAVAKALEQAKVELAGQQGFMRATDHQFQQPLVVGLMEKKGVPGVKFDAEGSGYGFRVISYLKAQQAEMPTTCVMQRP